MRWLITTRRNLSLEQLDELLDQWGCSRVENDPIPLGTDEQVVEVTGPSNLPAKATEDERVLSINPDSQMDYFLE